MTTAALHRDMVEALRAIRRMAAKPMRAWETGDVIDALQADELCQEALEGWEKRVPLRDQAEVLEILRRYVRPLFPQDRDAVVADAADAIEALLYGERG